MNSKNTLLFATLFFLTVASNGCGPKSGLERALVSGKVTLDGTPVANGSIRLVPTEGTTGPVSVGEIKDGNYTIDAKGGVPVGEHKVMIHAIRAIAGAKPVPIPEMGTIHKPTEQYIPEEYNRQSKLRITIESGAGEVTKDFNLDS